MMKFDQVISRLHKLENKEKVALKAQKFAVISHNSLGIYHKDLKIISKEIGKDSNLAIQLFDSGIYEAKILCSQIFDINDLTEALMEKWVKTFENWEICDSFCMGLFSKSKFALTKTEEWVTREPEFEKRAGFTIMAAYCMADKFANNKTFEAFFPIIKQEATDERIYVKKAINWALRNIGKRNIDLNKKAIALANEIIQLDSKSAKWIGKNALRELEKSTVNIFDYPREIYRPQI